MRSIRSPKRGLCMVTAFAMCLDCSVEALIEEIGHDGQEVVRPELEEPESLRGHHIQELVDCALNRGYAVTWIDAILQSIVRDKVYVEPFPQEDLERRFFGHISEAKCGVILGRNREKVPHAVAWNGRLCYDTNGRTYDLLDAPNQGFNDLMHFLRIDQIALRA